MNIKTTVILVVALLAAGGYMYFTREKSDEPKKIEEHKLVDIPTLLDVNKVVVTSSDGKKMIVEKKQDQWRINQPVDAPADGSEINGLIQSIINLKATNEVDAGAAAHTGLDKPQYVVELSGTQSAKVSFGDRLAIGNGVYTKVDGKDKIEVVDAGVLEKLDKSASSFRDVKLVDTPSLSIQQVSIVTKDQTLWLVRQGSDWRITQPQSIPADSAAVTDLLNALTGLKATSFVDDPSEQGEAMKGSPPVTSISFTTTPASTQPVVTQPATAPAMTTVTFGAYDDVLKKHVYAKVSNSPFIAKVDATALAAFNKKPLELRDKKLVDINPEEVSRFSYQFEKLASTEPATPQKLIVARRPEGSQAGVPFLPTDSATSRPAIPKSFSLPSAGKPLQWMGGFEKDGKTTMAPNYPLDDSRVQEFLTSLHPLHVDSYLTSTPATLPEDAYLDLDLQTEAAGGTKHTDYHFRFGYRGKDQPVQGWYNGVAFEIPRGTIAPVLDSFKKGASPSADVPPPTP